MFAFTPRSLIGFTNVVCVETSVRSDAMPLFEFVCEECHKRSEILVRNNKTPECPHCGARRLVKQASAFAPVIGASAQKAPAGCDASSCGRLREGTCPRL